MTNNAVERINTMEVKRPPRYQIGLDYSEDKEKKLKKFVSIIGSNVSKFTVEAIENEMTARLEDMPEDEKRAVQKLLEII